MWHLSCQPIAATTHPLFPNWPQQEYIENNEVIALKHAH